MDEVRRGIAIVTYNRADQIGEHIEAVLDNKPDNCKVVVCDDGSDDGTPEVVRKFPHVTYVRGMNLGVCANKNRALFSLQDCHFLAILEDDLFPVQRDWFEIYENVCLSTGIHHFCRVQDKEVEETVPNFAQWLKGHGYTPIYGPSPRGDFTFVSSLVTKNVGGFHPEFRGAGYGHGEWSGRVFNSGLIPHPLKWVDIKEARDMFYQKGDTEGGRWLLTKRELKEQLKRNSALAKRLRRMQYIFSPLILP